MTNFLWEEKFLKKPFQKKHFFSKKGKCFFQQNLKKIIFDQTLVKNNFFFDLGRRAWGHTTNPCFIFRIPTTIYVQNLSFFVSQILTSHNFFQFRRFTSYLWEIEKKYGTLIYDPHQKNGKKGKIWNFVKKSKFWKNHHFFSSLPFEYPFYPFCTFL